MEENINKNCGIRPDVMNYDDIRKMIPKLDGHEKLVNRVLHLLKLDEVNRIHSTYCDTPGPEFTRRVLAEEFHIPLRVDNEEVLARFKEGPFITVSNHPFGSVDGIALIALVSKYRPEFKVVVNMILAKITAMNPNFISVDQSASDDAEKRKVSVNGIRQMMRQLKEGKPLGIFPAGAMSKSDRHNFLQDREWQPSVLQIIAKAKVPVIPIYFHGNNSWWFNLLGHICWPMRSAMLAREMLKKRNKEMHISVGEPIMPGKQAEFNGDYIAL
ncbi:MAG: lysophospholipid acyltransferase family protein, partial [Muribaculum sp.]|nr:lysophospholipid acyltransferase family protein [Muribaculum sp.]